MPLFTAANLKYTIGTRVLLDGASLSIEPGQRVGLVGRNGSGKTTLMKIIMGRLQPDSGSVSLQKGARIGYLTQDPELTLTNTLREEAAAGFTALLGVHAELDEVYHQMGMPENGDPETLQRLMDQQSHLQERIEALGGYATDHKVDAILHGLGFTDRQFDIPVSGLSGGQKGRLSLAKLLLESPDLLLLDEPTNHLDIVGREWLENFLADEYRGAVLVVSHDRYLLNRVVERIEEIEQGRLIDYPGNYNSFVEIRKLRLLTQNRAYENQQSQWAKEEEYIRRFKAGQRAKEAQGRLSKLERQKAEFAVERPVEMGGIKLRLPEAPRSGDQVVVVREAAKSFSNAREEDGTVHEKVLFHDLSVTISRGEKWGVIGPNGAGKTTLVRAMLGQIPLDPGRGNVRIGASVVIGYYAQLPPDQDADLKVWEYLQRIIRRENPTGNQFSEQQARDLSGAFLFSGRDQDKQLASLSGGERSRARLAGLLASAKNLLILDEPTNHLDLSSAERLEEALKFTEDGEGYAGTLILISHDRALIDATCDHLLVLDGHGGVEVFHGNYREWHRKLDEKAAATAAAASSSATKPSKPAKAESKWDFGTPATPANGTKSKAKAAPGPGKGGGGRGAKESGGVAWMPADRLEKEIEKGGKRVKELDAMLADENVYRDSAKCRQVLRDRDEAAVQLERLEAEWLKRAESGG